MIFSRLSKRALFCALFFFGAALPLSSAHAQAPSEVSGLSGLLPVTTIDASENITTTLIVAASTVTADTVNISLSAEDITSDIERPRDDAYIGSFKLTPPQVQFTQGRNRRGVISIKYTPPDMGHGNTPIRTVRLTLTGGGATATVELTLVDVDGLLEGVTVPNEITVLKNTMGIAPDLPIYRANSTFRVTMGWIAENVDAEEFRRLLRQNPAGAAAAIDSLGEPSTGPRMVRRLSSSSEMAKQRLGFGNRSREWVSIRCPDFQFY